MKIKKGLESFLGENKNESTEEPKTSNDWENDYFISINPLNAGLTSSVSINDMPRRSEKDEVIKYIFYEDGEKKWTTDKEIFDFNVKSDKKCTKEIYFEIITKSGNNIKTKKYNIEFEGIEKIFKPSFCLLHVLPEKAGKTAIISTGVNEYGDKKGIKRVTFYEDDKEIAEFNKKVSIFYTHKVRYDEPQEHVYKIVAEDINGQIIESKPMNISFTGDYLPPKETKMHTSYDKSKRSLSLSLFAEDENNGDEAGIENMIFYEDGKKVKEGKSDCGNMLFQKITRPKGEKHEYHAEIINKAGVSYITPKEVVKFK